MKKKLQQRHPSWLPSTIGLSDAQTCRAPVGEFHWQSTLPNYLVLAAGSSCRFKSRRAGLSGIARGRKVQASFSPPAHLPSEWGVSIKTRRGPFLFGVCMSGAGQSFGQCLYGCLCVNSHFFYNEA